MPDPIAPSSEPEPRLDHDEAGPDDREPGWNVVVTGLGLAGAAGWIALLASLISGR